VAHRRVTASAHGLPLDSARGRIAEYDGGPYPWRWYLLAQLTRKPEGFAHDAVNNYALAGNLKIAADGRTPEVAAIPRLINGDNEQAMEVALRIRDQGVVPLQLAEKLGVTAMTLARAVEIDGANVKVVRATADGDEVVQGNRQFLTGAPAEIARQLMEKIRAT
jgi:hypothetical protein